MNRHIAYFTGLVGLAGTLLFQGCGCGSTPAKPPEKPSETPVEAEKETAQKTQKDVEFSLISPRFKPEDVLFTVNGRPVTRADYDLWCNLRGRLFCLSRRLPLTGKGKEVNQYMRAMAVRVFPELTRKELVADAAAKAGVEPDEAGLRDAEADLLESIGQTRSTFASVVKRLGPKYGSALTDFVRYNALEKAYLEKWATNDLNNVTAEEIEKQRQFNIEFNKKTDELNAESRQKALDAKKEIIEKDRQFAEVAKERADMNPEEGDRWQVFELAELEADDPFAQWLASAEVGDISDPIDFDDGLAIVGLRSKEPGNSAERPGEEVDFYDVVRILFKAYDKLEIPETDDEWSDAILDHRRREAIRALGKELLENADIQFPNGEDIFDEKTAKKGKKAVKKVKKQKKEDKTKAKDEPEEKGEVKQ